MRAVGQHATSESNVSSSKISAIEIPWKRIALYATLSIGFFLLGFVPTSLKTSRAIEQRDAAQRGVRLAQLQNTLAAAVIDVQRGQYEPARQLISDFYTNLRRQVDGDNGSLFTPAQHEGARYLLAERDELISLLARSDPAAADRAVAARRDRAAQPPALLRIGGARDQPVHVGQGHRAVVSRGLQGVGGRVQLS